MSEKGSSFVLRNADPNSFPNAGSPLPLLPQVLLSLIDPGLDFWKDYKDHIANKRLLLETFCRLQLPYYEEARLYWNKARADGYFAGANEILTYLPRTLKYLVEVYSTTE